MTTESVAVVLLEHGGSPRLDTVEVLDPQEDEVMVRVVAASVCASDTHAIEGFGWIDVVPTVLGHEAAGVVEKVGPSTRNVVVGDHVVVGPYGPCGWCYNCRTGLAPLCDSQVRIRGALGEMRDGRTRIRRAGKDIHAYAGVGSLAQHVVVREAQAIPIAKGLPLDLFAMAGCALLTGLGAVFNVGSVQPGDAVAVLGCGGVGLNVIQGSRIAGATTIIGIDNVDAKLRLASKLGATHTIDSSTCSIPGSVREILPRGVDVAFEVCGVADLVATCLETTRVGGTCVMVGIPPEGSIIPITREALSWQRRLVSCLGGGAVPARDIPRIVDFYRDGRLDIDSLVGQRLRPEQFEMAFENLKGGPLARSVVEFGTP